MFWATAYLCVSLIGMPVEPTCRRYWLSVHFKAALCLAAVDQYRDNLEYELTARGYRLASVDASCIQIAKRQRGPDKRQDENL